MKHFFLGVSLALVAALAPEVYAVELTAEVSEALSEDLITVLTYSGGVFAFLIGWLVGTLT